MREICKGKSFKDTCEMIRKQAIASDAKGSRGVNSTMVQLFADLVADKVNVNQTVVGQQLGEDEDAVVLANLSRIKPEIWKEIPRDVQQAIMKLRLEEAKTQTKEGKPEDKQRQDGVSNVALPRQYSKPKANLTQALSSSLDIVDEFLQQALGEEEELEEVITNAFNVITVGTSSNEGLIATCMNSINIQDYEKILILDNKANIFVLGKGWEVITVHPTRKAHIYGFDHQAAVEKHLDIVTAVSVVEVNGETILLQVNEAVHNPSADHSLLSGYQIRDYGVIINSVAKKHGGE